MKMRSIIPLLIACFWGCKPAQEQSGTPPCDTPQTPHTGIRGALLGSRFNSLDALKTVVHIEFEHGDPQLDSTLPENNWVRVRHCSSGRAVTSVLEKGTSQGDILKARYEGTLWDKVALVARDPYTVADRRGLEQIYALSRLRPEWFGADDVAFFEIAKSMVKHINTPDLAYQNPRDSTEKGYINSFNHLTAQAFISTCFSEELADFIADSHERYRHPELITGRFTAAQLADLDEGPVDNYVDLVNNEWGQELGKQLREKYRITPETVWTPRLLADYLNDVQQYYGWAFQIGFSPYVPEDEIVVKFARKLDLVMRGNLSFKQ